jgi:hypothetical protein
MRKEYGHCDLSAALSCSKRCVDCSHISPLLKPWFLKPEDLARDLAAIRPFMHFKVLQLVGGEPTLNKQLVELINVARASGVGDSVTVITNGELLPRMADDFWKAIDWLQLSIYPTLKPEIIELAKAKCLEFGKPFYSTVFTDFYQQFREPKNDGSHFATCHWRSSCWQLHAGHFAFCPQSLFMPKTFLQLEEFVDALPVTGLTEEKLDAFLNRSQPLESCKMCMANELKTRPWAEATGKDDWLTRSQAK